MASTKSYSDLFNDFTSVSALEWKNRIIKDLKGGDFDKLLIWKTYENVTIQPFYTTEDTAQFEYLKTFHQSQSKNLWLYREEIKVNTASEANKLALDAIAKGADSICFDLTSVELSDFPYAKLLADINPNQVPVSYIVSNPEKLILHIQQSNPSLSALKGSVYYDPLALTFTKGSNHDEGLKNLILLQKTFEQVTQFCSISVGSHHFHNSGASSVQELAFTLATAVAYIDYLTDRGFKADSIVTNIEFSISIGTNYFFEIAKIRALKWLWTKIVATYGAQTSFIKVHAKTSEWSKTVSDVYVNMLRNTTEAMAAITGGCTSLTVLPYNIALTEQADDFSRRISRNVSTILKEEAYFDKTTDPAAGSYYIEKLTDTFVEESWKLFLEVEEKGGIVNAFEAGFIQDQITAVLSQKAENLKSGKEVLVGTNKYIKADETIADQHKKETIKTPKNKLLAPIRAYELLS